VSFTEIQGAVEESDPQECPRYFQFYARFKQEYVHLNAYLLAWILFFSFVSSGTVFLQLITSKGKCNGEV